MAESTSEMLARVLHKRGGYVLVVGGGVEDLRLKEHPQVLLWDDRYAEWLNKDVPSNTRAIVWNRFVSHAKVDKLSKAAVSLQALKFPFLKPREIRELLADLLNAEPKPEIVPSPPIVSPHVHEEIQHIADEVLEISEPSGPIETPVTELNEDQMRKPKRGEMKEILEAEMNTTVLSYSLEAERLMPIMKARGIKITQPALAQQIRNLSKAQEQKPVEPQSKPKPKRKSEKRTKSTKSVIQKETITSDTFEEAEKMLHDALAAITLLMEFIPKLRAETAELRAKQAKIKALIED